MGNVLYEVSYQFDPMSFIPVIMLIAIPVLYLQEKQKGGGRLTGGSEVLLTASWVVILFVAIFAGKYQLDMYNSVINAYKNGEYQIVEGYVENFDPMPSDGGKVESFDINGVHFSYSDYTVMTGYHNAKSKGGVITGDGQYLKIGYIYYNDSVGNIIVYIEEILDVEYTIA